MLSVPKTPSQSIQYLRTKYSLSGKYLFRLSRPFLLNKMGLRVRQKIIMILHSTLKQTEKWLADCIAVQKSPYLYPNNSSTHDGTINPHCSFENLPSLHYNRFSQQILTALLVDCVWCIKNWSGFWSREDSVLGEKHTLSEKLNWIKRRARFRSFLFCLTFTFEQDIHFSSAKQSKTRISFR